jgi:hypothetical protein
MGKHDFENKVRNYIKITMVGSFYREKYIRLLQLRTLEGPIQLPVTFQFWFEYPQFSTIGECTPLLLQIPSILVQKHKNNFSSLFYLTEII